MTPLSLKPGDEVYVHAHGRLRLGLVRRWRRGGRTIEVEYHSPYVNPLGLALPTIIRAFPPRWTAPRREVEALSWDDRREAERNQGASIRIMDGIWSRLEGRP